MSRAVTTVALLAVALLAWSLYAKALRDQGVLREKISATEARVSARNRVIAVMADSLLATRLRIPKADAVLRVNQRAAGYWRQQYDSLAALVHRGDTLPGAVDHLIETGDSLTRACERSDASCTRSIAVRDTALAQVGRVIAQKDTVLWATDSLLTLERRRHPSWLSRTLTKVTWATIGFGAAKVLAR